MKKKLFLLFMIFGFTVFAEDNSSLLSGNTFGLFGNALDGVFTANENGSAPSLPDLTNPYIFGGLSNFEYQTLTTSPSSETDIPFLLGFYSPGKNPSSWLLKIDVETASDEGISDGNISTETDMVTDDSESAISNEYNWITEESNQVFSLSEALDLSGDFQFLIHTGIVNWGTLLSVDYAIGDLDAPLTWAESNRKITTLYNYDKMAGTPPPQAALDYAVTESWADPQTRMDLGIELPVYFKAANSGHYLNLGFTFSLIDDSSSHSIEYSEPVSTGPDENFSETESTSRDLLTGLTMEAAYTLTLPPLLPTHSNNFLEIAPWFSYRINIAEDSIDETETAEYSINMLQDAGDRKVLQSRILTEEVATLTLSDSYKGGIDFRHPLYFGLSESVVLGLGPALSLGYEKTPLVDPENQEYKDYIVTNATVTTVKTDSDGDGTYEQTVVTTVTSDSDGDGLAHIGSVLFTLPMVLRISRQNWPFEFTIASQVEAGADLHWTVDRYDTSTTVVETKDASGTVTDTTTTQQTGLVSTTSERFWSEWQFTQSNKLGFTFRFPKYVTLDVILNSSNLFDFDNLTVQTIIALP